MAEYIELNEAFETITNFAGRAGSKAEYSAYWKSAKALKTIPIADVAEVRHGEWLTRYIHNRLSSGAKVRWNVKSCSICTHTQLCVSDYCPRCGAKMNKE